MAAQEVQKELLEKLYELREEFYTTLKTLPEQSEGSEESKQLQDQLRRAEYRIGHLKRGIDELFASEAKLQAENVELKKRLAEQQK